MSELLIFSCNMMHLEMAKMLTKSCQRYGYELQFYGQGIGWVNFRQSKIDLPLQFLQNVKHKYVMYTDAFDSWMLRPDILGIYKTYDTPVIVSANRDHYPYTELYKEFPEAPTSMRYICSSQFIGLTSEVINVLEIIKSKYLGYTDQEGWQYCYTNNWIPQVKIDHSCNLFLNMTNVASEELDTTNEFYFKETHLNPASIHFGGPKGGHPNAINMKRFYEIWRSRNG